MEESYYKDVFEPSTILVACEDKQHSNSVMDWIKSLVPFCSVSVSIPVLGIITVKVPDGYSPHRISAEISKHSLVVSSEVNLRRTVCSIPNDPYIMANYDAYEAVKVFDAWDITRGAGVNVVLIDTGVDLNHPDLGNYGGGRCFYSGATPETPMSDWVGHGTATSGLVAAKQNNNTGLSGVAPDCTFFMARVYGPYKVECYVSDMIDAAMWAVDLKTATGKPTVISSSNGFNTASYVEQLVVNYIHDQGLVYCASSGNSSGDNEIPEDGDAAFFSQLMTKIVIDRVVSATAGRGFAVQGAGGVWILKGYIGRVVYPVNGTTEIYFTGDSIGMPFGNEHVYTFFSLDATAGMAMAFDVPFDNNNGNMTGPPLASYVYGIDFHVSDMVTDLDSYMYPSAYEHVISVGGTGGSDPSTMPEGGFYNRKWQPGTANDYVDVVAPAFRVFSTGSTNPAGYDYNAPFFNVATHTWETYDATVPYLRLHGTSFACPIVAGICALILSMNPSLSPDDVESILKTTADSNILNYAGTAPQTHGIGAGQVNAYAALGGGQNTIVTLTGTGGATGGVGSLFADGGQVLDEASPLGEGGTGGAGNLGASGTQAPTIDDLHGEGASGGSGNLGAGAEINTQTGIAGAGVQGSAGNLEASVVTEVPVKEVSNISGLILMETGLPIILLDFSDRTYTVQPL